MIDIAQDFQNISPFLEGWVLYVPGIIFVLAGLWVLFLGSGRIRIVSALIVGVFCAVGALFCDVRLMLVGAFVLAGMIGGAIFPKPAVILSSVIFAALAVVIFFSINDANLKGQISRYTTQVPKHLNTAESLTVLEDFANYTALQYKKVINNISTNQMAYIAGIAGAVFLFGIILSEVVVRMFCAIFGAALSWLGMFLLLCYKGTDTLNLILRKPNVYLQVFAGIILVGFLFQVILIPIPKKVKKDKKIESEAVK